MKLSKNGGTIIFDAPQVKPAVERKTRTRKERGLIQRRNPVLNRYEAIMVSIANNTSEILAASGDVGLPMLVGAFIQAVSVTVDFVKKGNYRKRMIRQVLRDLVNNKLIKIETDNEKDRNFPFVPGKVEVL